MTTKKEISEKINKIVVDSYYFWDTERDMRLFIIHALWLLSKNLKNEDEDFGKGIEGI